MPQPDYEADIGQDEGEWTFFIFRVFKDSKTRIEIGHSDRSYASRDEALTAASMKAQRSESERQAAERRARARARRRLPHAETVRLVLEGTQDQPGKDGLDRDGTAKGDPQRRPETGGGL